MRVGVLGGTALGSLAGEALTVHTPHGSVEAWLGSLGGREVVFVPRHGQGHALPPHRVNFRANVDALARAGARRVIGVNTVGSLRRDLPPGALAVCRDYVDFSARPGTFFDEEAVHVDQTEPYCPEVRAALKAGTNGAAEVVYACTQGPRLETPAEIRMLAQFADVVGMTGYPEVALARERGLCYGALCVVSNLAAGMQDRLTAREVGEATRQAQAALQKALEAAIAAIPERPACACADSLRDARLA